MDSENLILIKKDSHLKIEDIAKFHRASNSKVQIDYKLQEKINLNRSYLDDKINSGSDIYGVTTGFGNSASNRISPNLSSELQKNLIAYHGVGVGPYLNERDCKATLLVRMNCNARGYSGVSWELLQQMGRFLDHGITPAIPELGSVGASGDLTPLSYLGAALCGERNVYYNGEIVPTNQVLRQLGIAPYKLKPKEGLAIMNGTSVMTGILANTWDQVNRAVDVSCKIIPLMVEVMKGRSSPFHSRVHELKPHPGQGRIANEIYRRINNAEHRLGRRDSIEGQVEYGKAEKYRIQDSYSIRCAPQVLGTLADALEWTKGLIETEMNSVNDNPLIDDEKDSEGSILFKI